MLNIVFDIAAKLFPADLDDTVNKLGDQNTSEVYWNDIPYEMATPRPQVGLEALFSEQFYENLPNDQPKVNLTWSELPTNFRKRHVRETHEKCNYLRYNHLRSAELKLLLNNTHNKSEQHVLLLNHALQRRIL